MSGKYPIQSYISYTLATAHRKIHTSLTNRLKEFGVQVEAWRIMEILETKAELTMGDLADAALMNPSTLTKLVDRMVSNGMVHRRNAIKDHRQVNLVLTELGRKRIQQVRKQAQIEDEELAQKVGSEKIKILHDILSEIGDLELH